MGPPTGALLSVHASEVRCVKAPGRLSRPPARLLPRELRWTVFDCRATEFQPEPTSPVRGTTPTDTAQHEFPSRSEDVRRGELEEYSSCRLRRDLFQQGRAANIQQKEPIPGYQFIISLEKMTRTTMGWAVV